VSKFSVNDFTPENPFQSPVESIENVPVTRLPEIFGSLGVALVVSVAAFNFYPWFGFLVALISVATIAHGWTVVKRRDGARDRGRNPVLMTFVGSFFMMTVLVVVSLVVASIAGGAAISYSTQWIPYDQYGASRWIGIAGGGLGGLMVFSLGFWALLPKRVIAPKDHAVE